VVRVRIRWAFRLEQIFPRNKSIAIYFVEWEPKRIRIIFQNELNNKVLIQEAGKHCRNSNELWEVQFK
jgi:hypothetical protein